MDCALNCSSETPKFDLGPPAAVTVLRLFMALAAEIALPPDCCQRFLALILLRSHAQSRNFCIFTNFFGSLAEYDMAIWGGYTSSTIAQVQLLCGHKFNSLGLVVTGST